MDSGIAGKAYVLGCYKKVSGSNECNFSVNSTGPFLKNLHL